MSSAQAGGCPACGGELRAETAPTLDETDEETWLERLAEVDKEYPALRDLAHDAADQFRDRDITEKQAHQRLSERFPDLPAEAIIDAFGRGMWDSR